MIDISNLKPVINTYGGSELKATYYINNERYMVKMPDPVRSKKYEVSYMNNQFSEYIGCHIFESVEIPAQETLLVTIKVGDRQKIAVACKDFLMPKEKLIEIENVSISTSTEKKYTASIEDVYEMADRLERNFNLSKKEFIKRFWDMFVVDTLIGNTDRHLGNWGLIDNNGELRLAPIYDCGSSLCPLLAYDTKLSLLNDPVKFKNNSYNVMSVYTMNNKRIFYHEVYKNPPEDLKSSILEIVPKINMDKITSIINMTEGLNEVEKRFYLADIKCRKELILDKSLKLVKDNS